MELATLLVLTTRRLVRATQSRELAQARMQATLALALWCASGERAG